MNHPFNPMLFLLLQVLLLIVVQRHVVVAVVLAADNHHNFQWEGLHHKQRQQQQHEPTIRQRQRRRRTSGIKGGGRRLQDAAATTSTTTTASTTTTTTSTTGVDDITLIFPYMARKSHSDENKVKYKLNKRQQNAGYGERDCGWGRRNVVVHTVYDSRNMEEAKPNEYMSGLGFDFDVVSLSGVIEDDMNQLNGHWTQTVLAISENIRIGHDELTFYQSHNDNANTKTNNTGTEDVVQVHDMSSTVNKDQAVAGVLTTQFDSTRNVAIVTAGSGLFECAQGNPQVDFDEGSAVVTIVWDLCVCDSAMLPSPQEYYNEEDEEQEDDDTQHQEEEDLDHDEEAPEEEEEGQHDQQKPDGGSQ